jgi:hypothetical protein
MEITMRLRSKSFLAVGAILAITLGFAGLTKAAPLTGLMAAAPAVRPAVETTASKILPEKVYYRRHYYHRHYYHRRYHHRRYY